MKIYLSPSDQTGNKYAYGSTNEAAVCREIANAAAEALKRNGYDVRVGGKNTTYQERTADSNAWGADVHLPIHSNAGGGDGTVMFAYPSSVGNKYVKAVYESVAAISPGKDDGIRGVTNLYEINKSKAVCVYLEVEFHDNANLAKWITENTGALGEAIAKGFCNADGKAYKGAGGGASKPSGGGAAKYFVQCGAFSDRKNADGLSAKLKKAGFDAIIKTA